MQNNTPAPPDSSQYLSPGDNTGGRARSDSVRSQRSQRSQRSTENADFTRRPSIRIRRGPSYQPPPNAGQNSGNGNNIVEGQNIGRNRANSAPQEFDHDQIQEAQNPPRLSFVIEEPNSPTSGIPGRQPDLNLPAPRESDERQQIPAFVRTNTTPRRRSLRPARTNLANRREEPSQEGEEYDQNLVDLLDLVGMRLSCGGIILNVKLIRPRSRSRDTVNSHEPPKFSVRARSRKIFKPPTNIYTYSPPNRYRIIWKLE